MHRHSSKAPPPPRARSGSGSSSASTSAASHSGRWHPCVSTSLFCLVILQSFLILNLLYFPIPLYDVPFLKALSILQLARGDRAKFEKLYDKQVVANNILSTSLNQCLDKQQQQQQQEEGGILAAATLSSSATALSSPLPPPLEGVAVTLWLGSPRWFQNRYTMMLALVHAYLPPNWKIQVFHHPSKEMVRQAISYDGVRRLIEKGQVILTPLPPELASKKRKDILISPWLWRAVAAEKVLTFGGTSVICGNSPQSLADFSARFDFIGGPTGAYQGLGGDAGLTYRSRKFMIETAEGVQRETGFSRRDTGKEDTEIASFWSDALLVNRTIPFKIAKKGDTQRFALNDLTAATGSEVPKTYGAIGTLAGLTDEQRAVAVEYCPELKLFYPSLVHPSCFGAEPNPVLCFKYLCELGGLRCDKAASATASGKKGGSSVISISPAGA